MQGWFEQSSAPAGGVRWRLVLQLQHEPQHNNEPTCKEMVSQRVNGQAPQGPSACSKLGQGGCRGFMHASGSGEAQGGLGEGTSPIKPAHLRAGWLLGPSHTGWGRWLQEAFASTGWAGWPQGPCTHWVGQGGCRAFGMHWVGGSGCRAFGMHWVGQGGCRAFGMHWVGQGCRRLGML